MLSVDEKSQIHAWGASRPAADLCLGETVGLIRIPTLILCGDEDEACVKPSLFMKPAHPRERPGFLPGSGHEINLEEPDLFNRLCFDFLTAVEQGKR